MTLDKTWLEGSIKAVVKSKLSDEKKTSQIMRFIESYETTKNSVLKETLNKVIDQSVISGSKEGSRRLFGKDDFTNVILEAKEVIEEWRKQNE